MSGYPLLLTGERLAALVVGGGPVAYRKAIALLESGAVVRIVAPTMSSLTRSAAARYPDLQLIEREYESADIESAQLVIAATDVRAINARVAADGLAAGRLVNVADRPEEGNCVTVAVHRAGPVVIGVSAGGIPAVSRRIRDAIAERFGPSYGNAAAMLGRFRTALLDDGQNGATRWHEAQEELIGPDFCRDVETGAWAERAAQWR